MPEVNNEEALAAQAEEAKKTAITTGLEAIKAIVEDDELLLTSDLTMFVSSFTTNEIDLEGNALTKFVKNVEKLVRTSEEYKEYLGYLRHHKQMNVCSFLSNLDPEAYSLEFHHTPFTLFDIVIIVTYHMLGVGRPVTSMSVAEEVLNAHFKNLIGLVPVSITAHKLIHKGELTVSQRQVYGRWYDFVQVYAKGVEEADLEKLYRFIELDEKLSAAAATEKLAVDVDKIKLYTQDNQITLAQLKLITTGGFTATPPNEN